VTRQKANNWIASFLKTCFQSLWEQCGVSNSATLWNNKFFFNGLMCVAIYCFYLFRINWPEWREQGRQERNKCGSESIKVAVILDGFVNSMIQTDSNKVRQACPNTGHPIHDTCVLVHPNKICKSYLFSKCVHSLHGKEGVEGFGVYFFLIHSFLDTSLLAFILLCFTYWDH